jgi:aquaporin Z
MKATFKKNWRLYTAEALGLAIFMISACFFSAMLESHSSQIHDDIPDAFHRMVFMGVMMGFTAMFIFYSPFTSPSGSHINPAVTLVFFRLGRISKTDAFFYILFQFAGGVIAVYAMTALMGSTLTLAPVSYAATFPSKGAASALIMELIIGFMMMSMVLFTSALPRFSKHTKMIAAAMVCLNVIVAGPVSGFGMNPARSFASALPSGIWTAWWIYLFAPIVSMMCAAEVFLRFNKYSKYEKVDEVYSDHARREPVPLCSAGTGESGRRNGHHG